ncbi:MAG TPA: glycoside hydrolase family 44 protein [Candidatus Eremiobacteraceae bacterium]|nr:glycoside hydrolase family 44 protein [Candidatus Eremiobacteraceae bacterium]
MGIRNRLLCFDWIFASLAALALSFTLACNGISSTSSGSGSGSGGGSTPQGAAPSTPAGLTAIASNQQVSLAWNASSGATSYHIKRSNTHGGPYSQIAAPTTTNYTNAGLTNGTTYYYVVSAVNTTGESTNSSEVSATPSTAAAAIPMAPTGLTATAGNQQIVLNWNASSGATGYHVKRGTTSGGPYTQVAAPTGTIDTDTGLTNGTTYYYVLSAVNSAGESTNSSQVFATPSSSSTSSSASVHVTVDVLTDRHLISPYVYGGAYPQNASTITDSGLSVVRWGGNATSTYNWQTQTDNADNDWYFEDFNYTEIGDSDSSKFIQDVKAAGGNPLMTMVMLPWVAKTAENNNGHWSFSVAKYGAQCNLDPYNSDAGDGLKTDCATELTADPNDAYVPLLDQPGSSDPAGSVYRNQWAAALATAFGSAPHFYDMDNEIDIWGSTHFDIHPTPSGYNELRDTYLAEARALKTWDPAAIRLGPVSCCWWFYWNGQNNNDKGAHAGIDFLPWWLNEVYWQDQIAGTRSLDVFDIHAYPDTPSTSSFTTAQKQALATRIYRDYWDPTYVSESSSINQPWATSIQPNRTIPFRIPRMRALVNTVYPGTPLSVTEWSAEIVSASDFSTALGDADAYGILGRERVYLASRWTAPSPSNPNYLTLKLFTNYDGAHHGFGTTSVSDTNDADPSLFSSYAALNSTGTTLTLLALNKNPQNTVTTQFALNGFTPTSVVSYTLAASAPTAIVASSSHAWSSVVSFAPYSATLLVISGTMAQTPASEWDLNPDVIMVPANGTVTLQPKIIGGSANVTLTSQQSDSGISVALTQPSLTPNQTGTVTITAGSTPGFYHFSITSSDTSTVTQTQDGWILVGNPPATLAKTGDGQTGASGTQLALSVALNAGSSGGTNQGADIYFTTDGGTLSSSIVTTDTNGNAAVTLTLPSSPGPVHVTAQGPFGLGHPVVVFSETTQ